MSRHRKAVTIAVLAFSISISISAVSATAARRRTTSEPTQVLPIAATAVPTRGRLLGSGLPCAWITRSGAAARRNSAPRRRRHARHRGWQLYDGCRRAGRRALHRATAPGLLRAAVPSGPDVSHPTRVLGAGMLRVALQSRAVGHGAGRFRRSDLQGTSNVEVACLAITDHSGCVEFHSAILSCRRRAPFGPWARSGLSARDSHVFDFRISTSTAF